MAALATKATMARKKNPDEWKGKPLIIQLRGTLEFKEWAEGLAGYDRSSLADLVERALVRYARDIGYTTEAPPRT